MAALTIRFNAMYGTYTVDSEPFQSKSTKDTASFAVDFTFLPELTDDQRPTTAGYRILPKTA